MYLPALLVRPLPVASRPRRRRRSTTTPAWPVTPTRRLSVKTRDGAARSLQVPADALADSVHAKAACVDCHTGEAEIPHAARTFASRRDLTLALDAQCRRATSRTTPRPSTACTSSRWRGATGWRPVCVDCHGSHDVRKPSAPRTLIVADLREVPRGSRRRLRGQRPRPRTDRWQRRRARLHRLPSLARHRRPAPDRVGAADARDVRRCHANAAMMKKYGLSTNVLSTYLADFHGKTASLRGHQGTPVTGAVVARCTDCHGVHDIQKARDPQSPVIKANLLQTCRRCHADATENFPGAWLSHYEPEPAQGAARLRREGRLRGRHPVHDRRTRSPDSAPPLAADGESMRRPHVRFSAARARSSTSP